MYKWLSPNIWKGNLLKICVQLFKEPSSIASEFFPNFLRFWYQKKALFFSLGLPLKNITTNKCTISKIKLMKIWPGMVNIIKLTLRYRQQEYTYYLFMYPSELNDFNWNLKLKMMHELMSIKQIFKYCTSCCIGVIFNGQDRVIIPTLCFFCFSFFFSLLFLSPPSPIMPLLEIKIILKFVHYDEGNLEWHFVFQFLCYAYFHNMYMSTQTNIHMGQYQPVCKLLLKPLIWFTYPHIMLVTFHSASTSSFLTK